MMQKLLFTIVYIGALVRLYQLDGIPGEMFGDMVENYNHIERVLHGDFRIIYGFDGREGMLFYLAAPFAYVLGNSYLTLKIVTVCIGLVSIIVFYFFSKEFVGREIALTVAFLTAVSKWPLVYSRVGFRAILMPLFVSLAIYFLVRAYKDSRLRDFLLCSVMAGLGLYTYTAFRFAVVSVALIFLFLLITSRAWVKRNLVNIMLSACVFLLIASPMVIDYFRQPEAYFAHPGPMFFQEDGTLRGDWLPTLLVNITNQSLMLHVRGEPVFRVNPTRSSHLDVLSGIFFLAGLLVFLKRSKRVFIPFLFIPFIVLQFPSILVLNFPNDIPSMTRSIGVVPFVYLFVATGIWWLIGRMHMRLIAKTFCFILILSYIMFLNLTEYFITYPQELPNRNVAFDRVIADYITSLPHDTDIYLIGCCWGAWGQPHPLAIRYRIPFSKWERVHQLDEKFVCRNIESGPRFIIFSPHSAHDMKKVSRCFHQPAQEYVVDGQEVFRFISVTGG